MARLISLLGALTSTAAAAAAPAWKNKKVFLVMADWGGTPTPPYSTEAERRVAAAMASTNLNPSFALAIGDNFYDSGVASAADPRFRQTFEDVYAGLADPKFFRVIAGNHDHRGNITAQLAYAAPAASRWHYPGLWYDFVETAPDNSTLHAVMIDTVVLAGSSNQGADDLAGVALPGPANATQAEAQWAWINATLAASTADYLVVAGHYPIFSVCEHGPTPLFVARLLPMMAAAKASAYLGGHDHCAEYLEYGGVAHHGVGAAHEYNPSTKHADAVPKGALKWHYDPKKAEEGSPGWTSRGAFAVAEFDRKHLAVTHVDQDGKALFAAPHLHRRSQ